jgi:hypothetical protein
MAASECGRIGSTDLLKHLESFLVYVAQKIGLWYLTASALAFERGQICKLLPAAKIKHGAAGRRFSAIVAEARGRERQSCGQFFPASHCPKFSEP